MSPLSEVQKSNVSNFAFPASSEDANSTVPVAVIFGGTSGIGEAMVDAFGQFTQGNAHIVIVGRNKEAGDRILSRFPQPQESSQNLERIFIPCDVSLMRNVIGATAQIKSKFKKINYLVLSTGLLNMNNRIETAEGLETRLAVSYYSRWLEIKELVGLVEEAIAQDGKGRGVVLSILAPGHGGEVDTDDWEIKKAYSPGKLISSAVTYNDLMVEAWSDHQPKVPFVHAHPGFVRTPIFSRSPSYVIKFFGLVLATVVRFMTVSPAESAEWMWHTIALTHSRVNAKTEATEEQSVAGSWRTDPFGEDKKTADKYFGSVEKKEGLWKHTEEVIERSLKKDL